MGALGLVGILASAAAGLAGFGLVRPDRATAAASVGVVVIEGGISATGASEGGGGEWTAVHVGPGTYEVALPGEPASFEVRAWDAVADAVQTPLGGGRVEVAFRRGAEPVDSRFTFRATVPSR